MLARSALIANYYAGMPDLVLNKSQLLENHPPAEFVPDYRTGVPTISSDSSVRQAMACFDHGLMVITDNQFNWLPPETRAFVRAHTTPLALPPLLFGFVWQSRQGTPEGSCDAIRHLVARTQAARRAGAVLILLTAAAAVVDMSGSMTPDSTRDDFPRSDELPDLSVVVPLHNEQDNVRPLYEAIVNALEPAGNRVRAGADR